MPDRIRKRVTISQETNDKLLEMFSNNHEVGEFITYIIENTVSKLPNKKILSLEIEVSITRYKVK